ncbi:MAG: hypothetical protein AB9836_04895 [Aminipila sp.]
MAQAYLNRFNRQLHLFMMIAKDQLNGWTKEKHQLTQEEVKYLKTAVTYLKKVNDSLANRLDIDYLSRVINEASKYEFVLMPKSADEADKILVERTDIDILADHALVICQAGNYCRIEDHKSCPMYQTMMKLMVDVADCETDSCPYRLNVNLSEENMKKERRTLGIPEENKK